MKSFAILSTLVALSAAMCDHGTSHRPRNAKRQEGEEVTFDYGPTAGPLLWHGLTEEFGDCALGASQSPIDVLPSENTAVMGTELQLQIPDFPEGAEIENLGTTLEVFVNGSIQLNGQSYALQQFHFHTPSEHRLLGEYYPMETHFVFESPDGALAVVGFVVEVAGPDEPVSPLLTSVFQNVADVSQSGAIGETGPLSFASLMGHLSLSEVYQYGGSLTTPPCSESVSWNVVRSPLLIDPATYRQVKNILKFNSRYTQAATGTQNLLDEARVVLDAAAL
jgi:carbonic anhydrase